MPGHKIIKYGFDNKKIYLNKVLNAVVIIYFNRRVQTSKYYFYLENNGLNSSIKLEIKIQINHKLSIINFVKIVVLLLLIS